MINEQIDEHNRLISLLQQAEEYFELSIHTFQGHRNEFTIKNEPYLACTKCNNRFQAEPYQFEKTGAFFVYTAPTATAARNICHTLPLTAHGHCPAKNEPA